MIGILSLLSVMSGTTIAYLANAFPGSPSSFWRPAPVRSCSVGSPWRAPACPLFSKETSDL